MADAPAVTEVFAGIMEPVRIGPLPIVIIGFVVAGSRIGEEQPAIGIGVLGDDIDHAAEGRSAPQRRSCALDHLDLLDIQRRQHVPVELTGVAGVDRNPVEQQQHLVAGAERIAGGTADVDLIADKMDARRTLERLLDVGGAALLDLQRGDHRERYRRLVQRLLGLARGDDHRVHLDGSGPELHIKRRLFGGGEDNILQLPAAIAEHGDAHAVGAFRYLGHHVAAVAVRDRAAQSALNLNIGARQRLAALLVEDPATQRGLSMQRSGQRQENQKNKGKRGIAGF